MEQRKSRNEIIEKEVEAKLSAVHELISALQNNEYVQAVSPIEENGEISGYIIDFASGRRVKVELEQAGNDIIWSAISLRKYSDGSFYWIINGDWAVDTHGNKVCAGNVSPSIRIVEDDFSVSMDGGITWSELLLDEGNSMNLIESVSVEENLIVIKFADGYDIIFFRSPLLKMCYLSDTDELQGWDEGLFMEDGTWTLSKKYGDEGGYLVAFGMMDIPDRGVIGYFDDMFRLREIFIENYIVRLYNYTDVTADVAVIKDGKVIDVYNVELENLKWKTEPMSRGEVLTGAMNIIGGVISMADYMQLIADGRRYADILGGGGFFYNKIMFTLNMLSAVSGVDIISNRYVVGLLDLGGYILDLATSAKFPSPSSALGVAGGVIAVIGVYSNLWDTYWDLYHQAIDDVYGTCQASIHSIVTDGNEAKVVVNVSGYEPFGLIYYCGAAVDNSLLSPDVKESTLKEEVVGDMNYTFVYSGLEYGKDYKARPFIENADGISLWMSPIGNWSGPPLIRYGESVLFRIDKPSAFTGDCVEVTDNAAVLTCSFSGVSSQTSCGVEVTCDSGSFMYSASNTEGDQKIQLSGLSPATEYTYCAYIEYGDAIEYGCQRSFTTEMPDISGTWVCILEDESLSYTIILHPDGTVSYTDTKGNNRTVLSSSWSISKTGKVSISIMDLATTTANSGQNWTGQVNNIKWPTVITGSVQRWNYNNIGYFAGDAKGFIMKR